MPLLHSGEGCTYVVLEQTAYLILLSATKSGNHTVESEVYYLALY